MTELDLVQSPCTTSGQETERVNSYNPGARTGPMKPKTGEVMWIILSVSECWQQQHRRWQAVCSIEHIIWTNQRLS